MADVDVIPGLFKLDLPINDKNISQDTVKGKLLDIKQDLKSRSDRPEELAILNLLGLLKFALKQYNESLEHFHTVLEKDPDNLNAMANMQHVLLELYRKKEARCFQEKLEGFIGNGTKQEKIVKARARCLAEQAYVYAVDVHTDEDCEKRYEQSNYVFSKALLCAGEMVDTSEKDFWEFIIAKNLHKLLNKLGYRDNYAKASYMDTVVSLFFKIANRDQGDSEYRWESWRHLADLGRKIKTTKHFNYAHLQPRIRECINDPEKCMEQAKEISPNNPRLLARYANFVYSLKIENCYKRALELLHESISLDDSDYNFYAFSTRGMIYMKNYQWQMQKYNEHSGQFFLPHPNMLEKAKADLEKAVEFRNTAWDLVNLATVYHHFAKCDTVVSPEKQRQYLELELETLKRCKDCGDHSDRQKLQQTFGRCFFDLGEYRESIDCFKRAMHLESPGTQYTGYFLEMFCSYLSLLRSEYKDQHAQPIFEEMVQSMRKAITKYGSGGLTRYCFCPNLHKEYDHELQMLCNYCKQIKGNLDLLTLLKSTELSSQYIPVRPGGTLKESWENPIPRSILDTLARESRTRKFKAQASDVVTQRDAGHARGLGSDTQREGIGPLLSEVRDMQVKNSSGQKPPGNGRRLAASAAALFEGSDTEEKGEGIGPLMSGVNGLELRDPSDENAQGPRAQSRRAVESQSGTLSPDKERKFEYDFYVAHGDSDEKWVEDTLLHELMTVRELKGCTYTNDADLGSYVFQGKLDLMKQCACILFLPGEDFKDAQYLVQQTLKLAKEFGFVVIPIERDGLMVPDELSVMKSFDASAGRGDWDRLAQSIKNTKGAPSYCGMKKALNN